MLQLIFLGGMGRGYIKVIWWAKKKIRKKGKEDPHAKKKQRKQRTDDLYVGFVLLS